MTWRVTPHAGRLTTFVAATLVAGVATGRAELVSVGAAAAALLGYGLLRRPATVAATLAVSADRTVEGERVGVTVTVTATGAVESATVNVVLPPGVTVAEGAAAATVAVPAGGSREVTLLVAPRRWGVYEIGPAIVTTYAAGRLLGGSVTTGTETLRVLPREEEFRAPESHPFTRALAGAHPARVSGAGIEPVSVREFHPGDPLRRVNWRVTARTGELHVTEQRPERNAELVLFLDTFVDRGPEGETSLDVGVRAAAAIADHYLASMDRVGVVGFGGVTRWLLADAGRVHRHRIVEHLVGTNAFGTYAAKDVSVIPARTLPPRALVVALSPLLDTRATTALADLARRGYGLVVVDTSPRPLLPPARTWSRDLAQRLWLLERDALVHRLAEVGVPVVPWQGPGTLDRVLAEVSRLHARPRVALR
ncbi:MAG TPA: DUF58 domain-containing protein [Mycobacteriales bacterium]|nr:DUF58 domain-containing protein [Mycobacteriales bacterium]